MNRATLRLSAVLLLAVAFLGCGPFYDPSSYGSGGQDLGAASQGPSYPSYPSAPPSVAECTSSAGSPTGVVSTDLVATWQDWYGLTEQIVRFDRDGTVTVLAFPSFPPDPADLLPDGGYVDGASAPFPDTSKPPQVAFKGRYTVEASTASAAADVGGEQIDPSTVNITWDDGQLEVLTLTLTSIPDCTMLNLASDQSSRLPNVNGQLERVVCTWPQTPVGTVK